MCQYANAWTVGSTVCLDATWCNARWTTSCHLGLMFAADAPRWSVFRDDFTILLPQWVTMSYIGNRGMYVMICFTLRRRRWAIFGRAGARSNSKRCFALTTSTISRINRVSIGYSSSQLAVDFTWTSRGTARPLSCLVSTRWWALFQSTRRTWQRLLGGFFRNEITKKNCETRVLRWYNHNQC